jgi:hypothetical protein
MPTIPGSTQRDQPKDSEPVKELHALFRPALPYAGLRVRRGNIETAIHTFHRTEDQRTITLIGTQHIGEPAYYAELRKAIDELTIHGTVKVHYDLLRSTDESADTTSAQTQAERAAFSALYTETTNTTPTMPKRVGLPWITQMEGLPPDPDWVNTDCTAVDMARLLGPARRDPNRPPFGDRLLRALMIRLAAQPNDLTLLRVARDHYYANMARNVRHRARGIKDPVRAAVVGLWRESNATITALNEPHDVVMVWGAGHLAGFAPMLQRNGFELAKTRWVTAAHKPSTRQPPRPLPASNQGHTLMAPDPTPTALSAPPVSPQDIEPTVNSEPALVNDDKPGIDHPQGCEQVLPPPP